MVRVLERALLNLPSVGNQVNKRFKARSRDAGPKVRIRLPPAKSLRTIGPRRPSRAPEVSGRHSRSRSVAIRRRSDEVEVSVRHLRDLGFFDGEYYPNALNREFMRACYPEVKTE